jgi:hypothetical protein
MQAVLTPYLAIVACIQISPDVNQDWHVSSDSGASLPFPFQLLCDPLAYFSYAILWAL